MIDSPLTGYDLLLGVSGGVAAYKVCAVASGLTQQGAAVTVVMTRAARRFVTPLTFEALTGRRVYSSLWQAEEEYAPHHLSLTQRADLFLIAPATANVMGKAASGIADDLLTTMMTSATCPILMAPAMNPRMWANRIVQANVERLKQFGFEFIGPDEGRTACGEVGPGRMTEPEAIIEIVTKRLLARPPRGRDLRTS